MNFKIATTFGLIVILIIAIGAAIFIYQTSKRYAVLDQGSFIENSLKPPTDMVGNDQDEYGCIGSAGYQWCETKQKCLRIWEESCPNK
jgi:hypothetical protein